MSFISFSRAVGATIGVMVVYTAGYSFAARNSGGIPGLGSLLVLLFHAILALIAFPFVIFVLKGRPISLLSDRIIALEAGISSTIMLIFFIISPSLRGATLFALIGNSIFALFVYRKYRMHLEEVGSVFSNSQL